MLILLQIWQARLLKTSPNRHIVYIKETIWNGRQSLEWSWIKGVYASQVLVTDIGLQLL